MLSAGIMIAYGSGQPQHRKVVRNTWTVALSNSALSIAAGFAIFSYLGHFAEEKGVGMQELSQQAGGIGLSFKVFPAALALLPASNFFSVVFFLMLLSLGIGACARGGARRAARGASQSMQHAARYFFMTSVVMGSLVVSNRRL